MSTKIKPYKVSVPKTQLDDLHERLKKTIWPPVISGQNFGGPELAQMKDLVKKVLRFDWRKKEAELNKLPHFKTEIDGQTIHFIHVKSKEAHAIPILLMHGWPGSIVEFLEHIEPLTDPVNHGGRPEDAFDVVIPSLPGFAFSGPTQEAGWNNARIGKAFIELMMDHGDTFELCKECIDEGFTSVMIDASHENFEKNVEITRKVVEYAHKHNCVVESELGHLVGAQFDDGEEGGCHSASGHYTVPDEAVKFVKESGCDSLAIAIGNSHGAYKFKGEQHLDLERLKLIKKALMDAGMGDYPLVLHGASSVPKYLADEINKYGGAMGTDTAGVPEADIEVARRVGCTKVNIDTDLRMAMTAGIRKVLWEKPKEFDPRKYLSPARDMVKELVRHKIKNVLCCAGHAFD